MSEVIQFAVRRVEEDSERLMRILHRRQDMETTQKTLQEIRRLKREVERARERIEAQLNKIEEDKEWLRPSDTEVPFA